MKKNILILKQICKCIQKKTVLNQFYMNIQNGEIVNLIGMEDSGKEDVFSILFGQEKIDSGEIVFNRRSYTQMSQRIVEHAGGIFFINNDEPMVAELSVAENLYIVEKMNYFKRSVSRKKMETQAQFVFAKFGIDIAPGKKVGELNAFGQRILRVLRAYVKRAKLIVINDLMDDYLWQRMDKIIRILNQIKEEGTSILWINSYPDKITEIADKTYVIRQGKNVTTFYKGEYEKEKILNCMTGSANTAEKDLKHSLKNTYAFEVRDLSNFYISSTTFGCRNGEILGIYDVQNKFSREFRRTLLGRRFYNGSIRIGGKEYQAEQEYGAVRSGLGIIDGSKYQDHIFEELTILENIELPIYKKNARKRMFVNSRVTEYIRQKENEFLDLKKSNIQDKAIGLTRGEAMRLIFHRWLWVNPKVICCFQPFLRLDVESREFLYRIFLEFAHKGTGVIISSANVADLTPICDRIIEIDGNKIKESVEKSYFPDMFQN